MEESINPEGQKLLLKLARSTIAGKLEIDEPTPEIKPVPPFSSPRGAFVTLRKSGRLRGCIGTFSTQNPLKKTVEEMAQAAAFQDPRFPPLRPEEFPEIELEISALTPMRQVESVEEIEVGRHGIYIVQGFNSGVLLPQVATENNWDRKTFLEQTCFKAGLNHDCWRSEETRIFVFSAQVFGE
ncbi:MAG: AmmeMemoRadiSam system protein A [Deltaproteobacteria bacterium]|nr:AmmeMemoRadiSam system protein A [Deltaproteobacteria bacterium]MBW2052790.1 AmmeMemoRadiSam system protein A [Deltaproteobacteria bacterium]MBW2140426.1 AmmeMemoRadiSam system protein A [Deltaproteobacteria bacterium]